MDIVTAIIVEDEPSAQKNLFRKLSQNCPNIEILATSRTVDEAIAHIYEYQPQIVFLDVQLEDQSGFDVLARVKSISFEIIFTTAYEKYAIDAIKVGSLDYLLKPIKIEELKIAVSKAVAKVRQKIKESGPKIQKIAVPISNLDPEDLTTIKFIDPDYIIYCKADDRHSFIHLYPKEIIRVHQKLADLEEKLCGGYFPFARTHRSYIVNVDYVESFDRERFIHMNEGSSIPLGGRYKTGFWEFFKKRS